MRVSWGLGAVLAQCLADNQLHPVAYASRVLRGAERHYAITELETLAVAWAISHFRAYLYGNTVVVYTDHSAVKAILETPSANGKHARWWRKVYKSGISSVHVKYRPGRQNKNADCLSRIHEVDDLGTASSQVAHVTQITGINSICELLEASPQLSESFSLAEEQRGDSRLKKIIQFLTEGSLPNELSGVDRANLILESSAFCLDGGILYHVDAKDNDSKKVVAPISIRQILLNQYHGDRLEGHFSGARLCAVIAEKWWWKGMRQDAMKHFENCPACVTAVGPRPKKTRPTSASYTCRTSFSNSGSGQQGEYRCACAGC